MHLMATNILKSMCAKAGHTFPLAFMTVVSLRFFACISRDCKLETSSAEITDWPPICTIPNGTVHHFDLCTICTDFTVLYVIELKIQDYTQEDIPSITPTRLNFRGLSVLGPLNWDMNVIKQDKCVQSIKLRFTYT